MQISTIHLNTNTISALREFYCGDLGMMNLGAEQQPLYGYDRKQALLDIRADGQDIYQGQPDDLYWKIGITLRDLDKAVTFLRKKGWPVSDPVQFQNIGYMAHLRDPNGFSIELLQQGFEGREKPVGDGHPIGSQAILAHLTLRITDLSVAQTFCEETLGMRLMSIQPVEGRGFCLYFYAWSEEELPNPELEAVENREWLWARPYTVLELQHLQTFDGSLRKTGAGQSGFAGFAYRDTKVERMSQSLSSGSYLSAQALEMLR